MPHTPSLTPPLRTELQPTGVLTSLTLWVALCLSFTTAARAALSEAADGSHVATASEPLQPVAQVDLQRYQGRWYQIALYPNAFQRHCAGGTTADYALRDDGQVQVTNTCRLPQGGVSQVVGRARRQPREQAPGTDGTSTLAVRFAPAWLSWLPSVWAPYWVIQLADDYRYAVVGEPGRQYLWILSRTPSLAQADRLQILDRLRQQGYDPLKLQEEPQP